MKNDKWIIGIDLDGTLVRGIEYNEIHSVTPLTRQVIHELHKQGHMVVIDTGRGYVGAKGVYESIGLPVPTINYAGSYIHNPLDGNFESIINGVDHDVLDDIINNNKHSNKILGTSICTIDRSYMSDDYEPLKKLKEQIFKHKTRYYPDGIMPNIYDVEVMAMNIVYDCTREELSEIINDLEKQYGKDINVVDWIVDNDEIQIFGIEINSAHMSKGKALLQLAEVTGYSLENTMGIGDSPNDRDLMTSPKIGVAMKNSYQVILDLADEITEYKNTEDGVAKYLIKKFNLDI